ncbi:MAG: antibiotic biosynthesis monooxygenase, partial [Arthrobacter sp.]|nr:antibiotic biosynthesis monooxygenase [Arthrobacter sp.]
MRARPRQLAGCKNGWAVPAGTPKAPNGRQQPVIFIVVKFKVKPDWSDKWLGLVADFTEATRQEPGNLWFD